MVVIRDEREVIAESKRIFLRIGWNLKQNGAVLLNLFAIDFITFCLEWKQGLI